MPQISPNINLWVSQIKPPKSNPAKNELLHLAGELRVLVYWEEGSVGDTALGFRNEAMLVGRRV